MTLPAELRLQDVLVKVALSLGRARMDRSRKAQKGMGGGNRILAGSLFAAYLQNWCTPFPHYS